MPNAVAAALRRHGIDVVTSAEAGLLSSPDITQLEHARNTGRVIATQEGNFLGLHHRFEHAGIAYCQQGSRSIGEIVAGLMLIYEVFSAEDMVDHVEYI
jgi:hypothetical protein